MRWDEIVTTGVVVVAATFLSAAAGSAQTTDRPAVQSSEAVQSQAPASEALEGRTIELPQVDTPQAALMPRGLPPQELALELPPSDQPAPGLPVLDDKAFEGTVTRVSGNRVTLSDGTQLTVPAAQKHELRPGASIKTSYEERDGRRIIKSIEVTPGPATR